MSRKFIVTAAVLIAAAAFTIHAAGTTAQKGVDGANTALNASQAYNAAPAEVPDPVGYNDPRNLETAITAKADEMVADPNSDFYLPGVTVTLAVCVPSGEHLFDCSVQFSEPAMHFNLTYLVSADGLTFVSKAGQ